MINSHTLNNYNMEYTVIHDEKVFRFEILDFGQIAYLQYEQNEGIMDILHTFVPPSLEGKGIASSLMESALSYAANKKLKIKPSCVFAKVYIDRHTNYKDLLA